LSRCFRAVLRREEENESKSEPMQDRRTGKAQRVVASWQRARDGTRLQDRVGGKKSFIAGGDVHGIKLPSGGGFSGRSGLNPSASSAALPPRLFRSVHCDHVAKTRRAGQIFADPCRRRDL